VGQTTYQIENDIERTKDDLGANIHELEQKVKEITDWRYHYQNHPMTLLGAAFGGGILLATMFGGTGRRRFSASETQPAYRSGRPKQKAVETWDHIKDALVGVAAARVTDFVGELVPGFRDEFHSRAKQQSS
jgi:hypothetical protein